MCKQVVDRKIFLSSDGFGLNKKLSVFVITARIAAIQNGGWCTYSYPYDYL